VNWNQTNNPLERVVITGVRNQLQCGAPHVQPMRQRLSVKVQSPGGVL
jgi:hypothetical protein